MSLSVQRPPPLSATPRPARSSGRVLRHRLASWLSRPHRHRAKPLQGLPAPPACCRVASTKAWSTAVTQKVHGSTASQRMKRWHPLVQPLTWCRTSLHWRIVMLLLACRWCGRIDCQARSHRRESQVLSRWVIIGIANITVISCSQD